MLDIAFAQWCNWCSKSAKLREMLLKHKIKSLPYYYTKEIHKYKEQTFISFIYSYLVIRKCYNTVFFNFMNNLPRELHLWSSWPSWSNYHRILFFMICLFQEWSNRTSQNCSSFLQSQQVFLQENSNCFFNDIPNATAKTVSL